MESPEAQPGFATQADLKLLRDQVDQLQLILAEPRKPWYLEGSTLTSALAVLVALISFFISTYQGDQKELREKREEFRSVLEKLVSMKGEISRLENEEINSPAVRRKINDLHGNKDLYRSSAEMLAQDLGPNVLFIEYLIIGDQFADNESTHSHSKASEYFLKSLKKEVNANPIERNRAYRRLARLEITVPFRNIAQMRSYFNLAIYEVNQEVDDLRFTAGRTYQDWADAESFLNNDQESLEKLALAEKVFLRMSDDDWSKRGAVDEVRLSTGYTLLKIAKAKRNQGNHIDFREKLDEAEQAFLKISDHKDNGKLEAVEELRRHRLSASSWISAPPSLDPAPLWRSPLLDDAIRNLSREAPSNGLGRAQP